MKEKIEGFYEICKIRGLTGTQGVLIPIQNVPDLMLKDEVVNAVADGMFHIYAVTTIDQGLELMTGVAAGVPDKRGNYPAGSINGLVAERLNELADNLRQSTPFTSDVAGSIVETEIPDNGGMDEA